MPPPADRTDPNETPPNRKRGGGSPQHTLPFDSAAISAVGGAGASVRDRLAPRMASSGAAKADVRLGSRPRGSASVPAGGRSGTRHLGRFVIEGEIGSGGMGRILRLHDRDLGRPLAAKVLHREFERDEASLHKFMVEAQITGQLEHPNIVPVHELGLSEDGLPYIAQRLVEGLTLEVLLSIEGRSDRGPEEPAFHEALGLGRGLPSTLDQLLEVFSKVADAVSYAHSRGVLHRDLKPENVMVGRFGEVYLMDWGLARLVGADDHAAGRISLDLARRAEHANSALVTLDGTIVGTPAYMPPEQARGDVSQLDERSDVYSLGAILYQILARVPPFQGDTAWAVLDQVAAGALVPPRQRPSPATAAIPWELEAVVLKAMSPERGDRYASATELKDEVRAFLDHRPVAAASYSAAQRLGKIARRHTTALRLAGVVAAMLLGVFAVLRELDRRARGDVQVRQEGVLADEARGLDLALSRARAAAVDSSPPEAPAGRAAWFRARSELASASEAMIALSRHPAARVLLATELEGARATLVQTVESAAFEADRAGELSAAAAWVGRAPAELRAALATELDRRAAERATARRARIELLLARARELSPGAAGIDLLTVELVRTARAGARADTAADEAAREGVVAILLSPARLDAATAAERTAVIRALARLGAVPGKDVAAALVARLSVQPRPEPALAIELLRALGELADPRSAPALRAYRASCAVGTPEWAVALAAACALPVPGSGPDSKADGPVVPSSDAGERSAIDRARALADQRRPADALALIEPAPAAWRSSDLYLARATCLAALDRPAEAFAAVEIALALAPGAAQGWHELARLCAFAGLPEAAELAVTRACALAPEAAASWLHRARLRRAAGTFDGALADAERALAAGTPSGAGRAVRAEILLDLDRRAEAKVELGIAAGVDPTNPEIARLEGRMFLADRNADEALRALDRAISLDRELWPAYGDRARARGLAGDHAASLPDWDTYLEHTQRDASGHYEHAVALFAVDRPQEAILALDRALAIDARAVAALMLRARLLGGAGRYEAALADCARVLELAPGDHDLLFLRANIYVDSGCAELALADLAPILARNPGHVKALYVRAAANEAAGRWEDADRDLGIVLAHNEDLVAARFRRAIVAYARGDHERAMAELARVLAKQPSFPRALAQRALWRYEAGDVVSAVEDIALARRYAPRDASYAYTQARYLAHQAAQNRTGSAAALSRAFTALEESLALGHAGGPGFAAEPEWDAFRNHSRLQVAKVWARLRGLSSPALRRP